MARFFRPGGVWRADSVDTVRLQMDVGWFHALVVFVGVTGASRLALSQLGVQTSRLVRLAQLHPFDWILRSITLRKGSSGRAACRIYHNLFLSIRHGFHRVQASIVARRYFPAHELLLNLDLRLALESACVVATLEALTNV